MGDRQRMGKPSRYVTSHPGQFNLAIPPWVGAVNLSPKRQSLTIKKLGMNNIFILFIDSFWLLIVVHDCCRRRCTTFYCEWLKKYRYDCQKLCWPTTCMGCWCCSCCSSLRTLESIWSTRFHWTTWRTSVDLSFTGSTWTGLIAPRPVAEVCCSTRTLSQANSSQIKWGLGYVKYGSTCVIR